MPVHHFKEVHRLYVAAPPERVFDAIKAVTADEILFFRTLVWLRRFGRGGAESILNPPRRVPILEVATRTGFQLLADERPRELLVGTVVIAPDGARRDLAPEAFRTLSAPGYAWAAMNFVVEPDEAGGAWVTTETRVVATDAVSRRRFGRYWRAIHPGSALIRRMWLRAIRTRGESAANAAATPGTARRTRRRA